MKLNKESKDKLRKEIEERLKEVPEGERIKLDKELLEELLFEREMSNRDYGEVLAKFLVWSGDFLSKLDLSEISFDNMVWDLDYFGRYGSECFSDNSKDHYKGVNKVILRNTNANIDFSKSFEIKILGFVVISNVDFSGIDLSESNIEKNAETIINCDLSGTKIKFFPRTGDPYLLISNSNLSGLDMSNFSVELDNLDEDYVEQIDIIGENCNLKNSKIKINYDLQNNDYRHSNGFRNLSDLVSKGYLEGCYINGKLVKPLQNQTEEEIEANKQKILEEYTNFENDIYNSTITSLEEQTKKFKR